MLLKEKRRRYRVLLRERKSSKKYMGDTSPCLHAKGKEKWRMREDIIKYGVSCWSKFPNEEGSYRTL